MVDGKRYQPISVTEDITYNLQGNYDLSNSLNVSVDGIKKSPDKDCSIVNSTDFYYEYFGNFINTTIVNIKSP